MTFTACIGGAKSQIELMAPAMDRHYDQIKQEPIWALVDLELRSIDVRTKYEIWHKQYEAASRNEIIMVRLPDLADATRLETFVQDRCEQIATIVAPFEYDYTQMIWSSSNPAVTSDSTRDQLENLLSDAPLHTLSGFIHVHEYLSREELPLAFDSMSLPEIQKTIKSVELQAYEDGYIFWDDFFEYFIEMRLENE